MRILREYDDLTGRFKHWIDDEFLTQGDVLTVILDDGREVVLRLEGVFTSKDEVNTA